MGCGLFIEDRSFNLKDLHLRKHKTLSHKEDTIRHKSRSIWLEARDENTRYFHQYANRRRLTNSIWEALDGQINLVFDQKSIKAGANSYFTSLYKILSSTIYVISW